MLCPAGSHRKVTPKEEWVEPSQQLWVEGGWHGLNSHSGATKPPSLWNLMAQTGVTLNWGLLLHCFLMLVQTSEKRPAIRVCCKCLSQTCQRDAPRPCFACTSPHGSFPNRTKYSTPLPSILSSALRNYVSWRPYYEVSVSLFPSHKKHLSFETHRGVIKYSSLQDNRLLIILHA